MVSKTELKIEKLKEEKRDLEFQINQFISTFITLLIFLATITISAANEIPNLCYKSIFVIFMLIVMFILFLKFQKGPDGIDAKTKSLELKQKEIKKLYESLLK